MSYEELKKELQEMPMTWHPAILMVVVESALKHKCFVKGGMTRVIAKAEGESVPREEAQLAGDTERLLQINELRSAIHAAHGLLAPLGSQVTPSWIAIREALSILRRHL